MEGKEKVLEELKSAFYEENDEKVEELTKKALEAKCDSLELIQKYFTKWTDDIVGRGWYSGGGYEVPKVGVERMDECVMLSDLIMVSECLQRAIAVLRPSLKAAKVEMPGRAIIGTVMGDVHDIGKAIVASVWLSQGYAVIDLGIDVPSDIFIREAQKSKPDIVGMSCSMQMCRPEFGKVMGGLKRVGIRDDAKIFIGGQMAYATDKERYGVDAFCRDVGDAMTKGVEQMRILKEERAKGKKG